MLSVLPARAVVQLVAARMSRSQSQPLGQSSHVSVKPVDEVDAPGEMLTSAEVCVDIVGEVEVRPSVAAAVDHDAVVSKPADHHIGAVVIV